MAKDFETKRRQEWVQNVQSPMPARWWHYVIMVGVMFLTMIVLPVGAV